MFQPSLRMFAALSFTVCLAACGSCGEPDDPATSITIDFGTDTSVDMGEDATETPDVGPSDMGPADMPPVDSDGDGVFDPDDNCPDVPNMEQLDRDRDGLGDECDSLPFIHDPTNPATIFSVMEDEAVMSNDSPLSGLGYDLELPFVARGVVGSADDIGDYDYYTFEIDKPTHLLMRLTASQNIWAGAVIYGVDYATLNVFRAEIAPDMGVSSDREMFLPFPGRYTLLMTDARNLIESQADVGGAGLQYAVSVSPLPLPEPQQVTLPSPPITVEDTGAARVYEVAVDGVAGLRVTSTGLPQDANSFVLPSVTLYDPDAEQGLAITTVGQSAETSVSTVALKMKERSRIWVIDDFSQDFGTISTRMEFATANLAAETETLSAPADTRESDIPWLEIGESMTATIGQPRAAGGDEDFFLFSALPGQLLRLTVTPDPGSLLEPFIELSYFTEQLGFPTVIHESEGGPGQATTVDYLITAYNAGEIAAYVQHSPNAFGSNPVGGSSYGYTVKIEEIQPQPVVISAIPGSASLTFGAGGLGIASFTGTAGDILAVAQESDLIGDLRVIDASTWKVLADDWTSVTFGPPTDGEYWVDLRDVTGAGTATPATINVSRTTPTALGALPAKVAGIFDVEPVHLYSFVATAGDKIDIRLRSPSFFGSLDLYDSTFQPVDSRFYEDRQFTAKADGTYVLAVSSGGSVNPAYDYELGVQRILATPSPVPLNTSGVFDDQPHAKWFQLPVMMGTGYSGSIRSSESAFFERITMYDEDLGFLRSSVGGTLRWTADFTGSVWLVVEDDMNSGGPTYDYTLAFVPTVTQSIAPGLPTAGQLPTGADENLHTFMLPAGAMIEASVVATGDWRPEIALLNADTLTKVTEPTTYLSTVRYAVSAPGQFTLAVASADKGATGPLAYTVTVNLVNQVGGSAEAEPNDLQADAQDPGAPPVAISGTVAATDLDRFRLRLTRGQRLWALTTDRNGFGTSRFDARLEVRNEADTVVQSNSYSGEGWMPAIYAYEIPVSGEYQVQYGARSGGTADGDYTLYLATSAVANVTQMEPNDSVATAQSLGEFWGPNRVSASVDGTDMTDVYSFVVGAGGARVRAALENAGAGHQLRLLDGAGSEIVNTGAISDPEIDQAGLAAGTYYLELSAGTGSGTVDLIIIVE